MALSEATREKLAELVSSHPVVLFMKGNRQFPQCGFSAQVVQILNGLIPKYETVNVLADPAVREGIKEFSSWPTIPQLYVKGQFVGGCDIVRDLHESGELSKLLGVDSGADAEAGSKPAAPPKIQVSDRAASALKAADEGGGDKLRLEITSSFGYDLYFAPPNAADVEVVANGVVLRLDAASASRAEGLSIDFVEGSGGGFKIVSPQETPRVKRLSGPELKRMLDAGTPLELIDVRTEQERAIAALPSSRLLDEAAEAHLAKLDKDRTLVFYCHHGPRAQRAAQHFVGEGFRNVYNLDGGIEAWSVGVDRSVPRY